MRFSRIVSALTCAIVLNAQATPVENYTQCLPAGANLALVVQKIDTTTPTIDYHSQRMALPASTHKVITALAALLQLGPNYPPHYHVVEPRQHQRRRSVRQSDRPLQRQSDL